MSKIDMKVSSFRFDSDDDGECIGVTLLHKATGIEVSCVAFKDFERNRQLALKTLSGTLDHYMFLLKHGVALENPISIAIA